MLVVVVVVVVVVDLQAKLLRVYHRSGGGPAECRPYRRDRQQDRMLFVFGDSFVDVGSSSPPPTADKSMSSRQWFYPFGSSDEAHHKQIS